MRRATIYRVTNTVNGKRYVGLTVRTVGQRWKEHVRAARRARSHFHQAIAKYGAEAFVVETIASAVEIGYAGELERLVIEQEAPEYNQTNGGEVTLGRKYDDATKERIRKSNTGAKRTIEQRQRMSAAQRQRYMDPGERARTAVRLDEARSLIDQGARIAALRAAVMGKPRSEAFRKKMQVVATGRIHDEATKTKIAAAKRKAVRCVTHGVEFDSIKSASEHYNLHMASISKVATGQRNSIYGLQFEFIRS